MTVAPQPLTIDTGKSGAVSALLSRSDAPRACYVFAHGAGAGMTHSFMEAFANGLCERGIACLRYQFPYMEKGGRRPDPPAIAQATVRAAVARAGEKFPGLALVVPGDALEAAKYVQGTVLPAMAAVREVADKLERIVPDDLWPLPKYSEILFIK